MADETFQNVLDVYKQNKIITSKSHSCSNIRKTRRGKFEEALHGIHILNESYLRSFICSVFSKDASYSKCLERIEYLPQLPGIDVKEARKLFLLQFVKTFSFILSVSHLGYNLYLQALVDKRDEVIHKLHRDYHVEFTLFEYPLHLAVECHLLRMVEFLVNVKKMDVNCVDNEGNTLLHHLMKYNPCGGWRSSEKFKLILFYFILQFLKSKGAKLLVYNKNGRTPLQYAIVHKHITDVDNFIAMCQDFCDFNYETLIEILELSAAKRMFIYDEESSLEGVNTYKRALRERSKQKIPNTKKKEPQELFFENIVEPDTENSEFLNLICTARGKRKRLVLGLLIFERILGCKHFYFLEACSECFFFLCDAVCDDDLSTQYVLDSLKIYSNFFKNMKFFDPYKIYEMEKFDIEEGTCSVQIVTQYLFQLRHFTENSEKYTSKELLDVLSHLYVGGIKMKIEQDVIPCHEDKMELLHFLITILSRN
ncbi:uncharacterized protein LOC134283435 [Saccostrea cucullata]|uniref:uncharacterized protein LOC134283435 n=1 Tax=Saccostrea cuccullata TaxID=36930 RepID=UPI002ED3D743